MKSEASGNTGPVGIEWCILMSMTAIVSCLTAGTCLLLSMKLHSVKSRASVPCKVMQFFAKGFGDGIQDIECDVVVHS